MIGLVKAFLSNQMVTRREINAWLRTQWGTLRIREKHVIGWRCAQDLSVLYCDEYK